MTLFSFLALSLRYKFSFQEPAEHLEQFATFQQTQKQPTIGHISLEGLQQPDMDVAMEEPSGDWCTTHQGADVSVKKATNGKSFQGTLKSQSKE
jgi:hypothetical protein